MVKAPGDRIVDVIAVWHRLVSAPRVVGMTRVAVDGIGVAVGMRGIHRDHMLIDVVAVRMV
jgi:hypothetical protein